MGNGSSLSVNVWARPVQVSSAFLPTLLLSCCCLSISSACSNSKQSLVNTVVKHIRTSGSLPFRNGLTALKQSAAFLWKKICFDTLEFAIWLLGDNRRDLNFALSFAKVKLVASVLLMISLNYIVVTEKQIFVVFVAKVRGR